MRHGGPLRPVPTAQVIRSYRLEKGEFGFPSCDFRRPTRNSRSLPSLFIAGEALRGAGALSGARGPARAHRRRTMARKSVTSASVNTIGDGNVRQWCFTVYH